MLYLVKWSKFSVKDWTIIGLAMTLLIVILFFILFIFVYKRKRLKFKINNIINDNLLKIGKNNYKFSNRNAFILIQEIKTLVLDKRYKYFYKFKKRYKDGNLNNELFEVVNKYYLKNEKELVKKLKNVGENKKNEKNEKNDITVKKSRTNKKPKAAKWVFDDQKMIVKLEEEK